MFGFGKSEDDAMAILTADHRKVDQLFKEFEAETSRSRKRELALRVCDELGVHAKAEEEIFYPQCLVALEQESSEERGLIWEATVEHGTLEGIMEIIRELDGDDEQFDSHVKVLSEYVKHHVREEESQIFPAVRKTDLDMHAIGRQITERKRELRLEIGSGSNGGGRKAGQGSRKVTHASRVS